MGLAVLLHTRSQKISGFLEVFALAHLYYGTRGRQETTLNAQHVCMSNDQISKLLSALSTRKRNFDYRRHFIDYDNVDWKTHHADATITKNFSEDHHWVIALDIEAKTIYADGRELMVGDSLPIPLRNRQVIS
jgi:hypothetical protein